MTFLFFFTASCVSILGTDVTDIFQPFWHFVRNWTINLKKKMHSKKIMYCVEKSICSRKRSQNDVKMCYLKRKKTSWNAVNKEKHFIYLHLVSMQNSDVDFWSYVISSSHDRTVLWVMKAEDAQWRVTTINSLLVCTGCRSHILPVPFSTGSQSSDKKWCSHYTSHYILRPLSNDCVPFGGSAGLAVSLICDQFSSSLQEDGLSPREQELKDLKESLQDTQPVGVLVDSCRTMDQVWTLHRHVAALRVPRY